MAHRLAASTSPYLRQHADNPVDWWEWGEDAFADARERDVPVLLSVGYSACHWCHVMAHESFEDPGTASLMNERFTCIKVDREERPDVDAVYMAAVQAMTGHGGWPMTAFLTPAGEPFFAGTYYPKEPRGGMPSFVQVLTAVSGTWAERRSEVVEAAQEAVRRLASIDPLRAEEQPPDADDLEAAVRVLSRQFDPRHAGFGGAPKFPPSMTIEHLLRHHARTGDDDALFMASRTLEAMARGGIYDQLAGGFSRYSVDEAWVVPHFEKMLYDNALLLRAYLHGWRATGSALHRRVADECADFLLRDLLTDQGGFASALDADTEGVEGRFYVWTPEQLREVLGEDDANWVAELLAVTPGGTFEHGQSVLQLLNDPEDAERWRAVRSALMAARAHRTPPARDDKVVAAWNGMAIAALAEAAILLERPELLAAAERCADLLLSVHLEVRGGSATLLRTSIDGQAGRHVGVLEDYACVAEGFLALYAASGDSSWFEVAQMLVLDALTRFRDQDGALVDTAIDAEALVVRPSDPADNATPSGRSAMASALLGLSALNGDAELRAAAERALGAARRLARTAPRFAGWGLAVGEAALDGPLQLVVATGDQPDEGRAMHRIAMASTAPGAVVAWADGSSGPPLTHDRPAIGGRATAYPCRGFVCDLPLTDAAELGRRAGVAVSI